MTKKPDGFGEFDKLARKLVQVPPRELPMVNPQESMDADDMGQFHGPTDMGNTNDELSRGMDTCDICGVAKPHSHDPEEVEIERYARPAFEQTTVPRGCFDKCRHRPYMDENTEALWQHFLSGWFAAKRHYGFILK